MRTDEGGTWKHLVRTPDGWWLTASPASTAEPIDVRDLAHHFGLDTLEADRRSFISDVDAPAGPPRFWAPAWMWAGQVLGHGVLVDGPGGEQGYLDGTDLLVLDSLSAPADARTVGVQAQLSVDESLRRLERLATLSLVRELPGTSGPVQHAGQGSESSPDIEAPSSTDHSENELGALSEPALPDPAQLVDQRPSTSLLGRLRRRSRDATAADPMAAPAVRRAGQLLGRGATESAEAGRPGDPDPVDRSRVPVYAIWHPHAGPLLSLGMLTAAARAHDGGALLATYEIRRPETAESFLADLAERSGPAVLLCSDYVWSMARNLETASAAASICDRLIVLHGGPSCPKYAGDAHRFIEEHGEIAHVLVRGEGEAVVPRLLETLASTDFDPRSDRLAEIPGLTFRDPVGTIVRTPDQERLVDLDALPSPYLTGEFDDIDADAWMFCLSVETTRGCPYGCSFCDWGSSTLSRIRKFSLDRVAAEIEWAAKRGINTVNLTDANFGIISRDVDTARSIAEIKERTGFPNDVAFYPAKNTTKHLAEIMDVFLGAGILPAGSLSLQTSDPASLEAVQRSNIATEHYVALASEYRRRGLPLHGDLLIGIPEQTFDSFRKDLQFNIDHEIMSRTWQVQLLPNAPMNDPEYRLRHGIRSDSTGRVIETATFGAEQRERMLRLRRLDIIFERYGLLRHVLRYLQWDCGIDATELIVKILDATEQDPDEYPLLTWIVSFFDQFPVAAVGWASFYEEVGRFVLENVAVDADSALATVLGLQQFLMPAPGRTFPSSIQLSHDYLAYYRDATVSLYVSGAAGSPSRRLADYPPATFTVDGDPLELCEFGMSYPSPSNDPTMENDFVIGGASAYELESELMRFLPWVAARGVAPRLPADLPPVTERRSGRSQPVAISDSKPS